MIPQSPRLGPRHPTARHRRLHISRGIFKLRKIKHSISRRLTAHLDLGELRTHDFRCGPKNASPSNKGGAAHRAAKRLKRGYR